MHACMYTTIAQYSRYNVHMLCSIQLTVLSHVMASVGMPVVFCACGIQLTCNHIQHDTKGITESVYSVRRDAGIGHAHIVY